MTQQRGGNTVSFTMTDLRSTATAVKTNGFLKEEKKLGEKYGVEVRIRGRSVTLSAKNDEAFKELLGKL